jgi:CRISPR/Cas system-associated protein Csm6
MTKDNEPKEHCLECGEILTDSTYAIYRSKNKSNKENSDNGQEEIAGYLCERCRTKHKIKPVKNINEFEKLLKLKDSLE